MTVTSAHQASLFAPDTMRFVREQFAYLDHDAGGARRLFFENSGGSLRLAAASQRALEVSLYPESASRPTKIARGLADIQKRGEDDLFTFFGTQPDTGSLLVTATASQAMFTIVRAVAENVAGTNIVTTAIEHGSSFDACARYAALTGQQLRVAPPNPASGGIDAYSVGELVDSGTSLVSVIATSNITGAITDIAEVVRAVRAKNPDVFVIVDAVQYAAHGVIDVDAWGVDAVNIAPYKMFGDRGHAFTYLTERLSELPHDKLSGADNKTWKLGSAAPACYAGFTAIVDYLVAVGGSSEGTPRREALVAGMEAIQQHEQALLRALIGGTDVQPGLVDIPGVTAYFADRLDDAPRDLIIPIAFDNLAHAAAVRAYESQGVIVYERVATNHYSRRILQSLGLDGIVRVSPLHCHSIDDVNTFLAATFGIAAGALTVPTHPRGA